MLFLLPYMDVTLVEIPSPIKVISTSIKPNFTGGFPVGDFEKLLEMDDDSILSILSGILEKCHILNRSYQFTNLLHSGNEINVTNIRLKDPPPLTPALSYSLRRVKIA
ncbi:hypothetical protein CDAR_186741 [Caerostris darwini]|uniref:Uncharacterized protein n=1 Tax=Caerostris darwini TaxID=1538125 RepID=A0AAV4PQW6_9ARAC|nr:hypothetical protein CDAR_186741 [Caerostris darwini]